VCQAESLFKIIEKTRDFATFLNGHSRDVVIRRIGCGVLQHHPRGMLRFVNVVGVHP
jgi:hypothetical protein